MIELNDGEGGNNGIAFQGGSFGLCVAGDTRNNVASCNRVAGHDAFAREIGISADSASNGVTDNVDYRPFATSLPACVDCTSNADCTDGIVCNGAETRNVGTGLCQAGSAPDCSGVADPCNASACTEPLRTCVQDPLCNGTPCSTGIARSIQDSCQAGLCTSGSGGDLDGICDADEIAGLRIRRAIMRKGALTNMDSWQAKGELDVTTSADFNAEVQTDGLEVVLYKGSDGGPVVVNPFPFASCTVKAGSVRCRDTVTRSSIRLAKRSAQECFRVNARSRQQSYTLPTVVETPLEVSIRATESGDTIDRDDDIGGCARKTATKLFCREAP